MDAWHADDFTVSRTNDLWQNTPRRWSAPMRNGTEWSARASRAATLVHLDGRAHRQVINDWFKPAVGGTRQPRTDEFYIERMRDLGGTCNFAKAIAQP